MPIRLHLITPERSLPVREADHITFTAIDGQIGVRPGHAPLVALMGIGFVELKSAGQADVLIAVRGGVAQVFKDDLNILADAAVDVASINEDALHQKLEALGQQVPKDALEAKRADDDAKWCLAQIALTQRTANVSGSVSAARKAVH